MHISFTVMRVQGLGQMARMPKIITQNTLNFSTKMWRASALFTKKTLEIDSRMIAFNYSSQEIDEVPRIVLAFFDITVSYCANLINSQVTPQSVHWGTSKIFLSQSKSNGL